MFRFIDLYLKNWAISKNRKPLLIRGARQVGKTFAVRKLGKSFEHFVEINFEESPSLKKIFSEELDLDPNRITRDLALALNTTIEPGKTLLFFDESQIAPRVILALRYFYEKMPELHVIAAGSLLEFAIEQIGIPVGRVEFYHLYPMTFLEYLHALNEKGVAEEILIHPIEEPLSDIVHERIFTLLSEYIAIGGMPEVVYTWTETKDPLACAKIHHNILRAYRQDFGKYAKNHQIKYVEVLFEGAIRQLGKKFKFSSIEGDYRKRELSPALDLLEKADIIHRVYQSSGQGIPIGATANHEKYKIILVDIGLTQALLGLDLSDWFLNSQSAFVNRGTIVEAFVGQELLGYSKTYLDSKLYYWQRDVKGSEAEIDYLMQMDGAIIPIEVKSNRGGSIKSLHMYLSNFPNTPFGVRFSTNNYSIHQKIYSYPLYAIAKLLGMKDQIPVCYHTL